MIVGRPLTHSDTCITALGCRCQQLRAVASSFLRSLRAGYRPPPDTPNKRLRRAPEALAGWPGG
eukprot:3927569-Alexandrium_andersonii.AAC.1